MVKKAARVIIEKYYGKLTLDFDVNKKIAEEVATIPSKRVRNQIAGFITHLMKRIHRGGSVRGISLKLQEEERERRLDFLPERSVLDVETVDIDADTHDLLRSLGFGDVSGVTISNPVHESYNRGNQQQQRDRRPKGEKRDGKKDGKETNKA
jgi:small subunit ribosomal protein S17e